MKLFSLFVGRLRVIRNLLIYDYFNLNYFNKNIKHFNIFLGMAYLQRLDSFNLLFGLFSFLKKITISFSNVHIISLKMGRLVAFELNMIKATMPLKVFQLIGISKSQLIYLCGVDLDSLKLTSTLNKFLVFQGSFSDNNESMNQFNLILPVGVYTEVESTYLNLEGRIRRTKSAIKAHLNILEDWQIFQTLLVLGKSLCFLNFSIVLNFFYIMNFFSYVIKYTCSFFYNIINLVNIIKSFFSFYSYNVSFFFQSFLFPKVNKIIWINSFFCGSIQNYYMSDAYARNSKTMMLCARKLNIFAFNKVF